MCFKSRPGHIARECPEAEGGRGGSGGGGGGNVCYRCDRLLDFVTPAITEHRVKHKVE